MQHFKSGNQAIWYKLPFKTITVSANEITLIHVHQNFIIDSGYAYYNRLTLFTEWFLTAVAHLMIHVKQLSMCRAWLWVHIYVMYSYSESLPHEESCD